MSTEPPGDQGDARSSRPWLSAHDDSRANDSTGDRPARKVRMVGSVSDAGLDDGLGLTGPGAPGRGLTKGDDQHPVRARLLEKARATGKSEEEGRATAPSPEAPVSQTPPVVEVIPSRDVSTIPFLDEPPAPPLPEKRDAPSLPQALPQISVSAPTPHPGAVASELERIARRTTPAPQGPGLSPNMIAVIGGLLGLTVITTLGLFLGRTEVKPTVSAPEAAPKEAAPDETPKKEEVARPKREKIPGPWRISDDASKPGHRVLSGKIGKLAFLTAIQEAGLPKSEAYRAYGALKTELDLDHCKAQDTFQVLVRGPEKQLIAFEYIVTKEDIYQVKENKDGKLEAGKLDLKVTRNQIRRSFVHDGKSFEESARRAGFDPGLSAIAEIALRGHSSMEDFRRGDRLRIIAQEVTVLGEFSRYAGLEAMEIVRSGEEPRRIYYYPHPVEGGYFDTVGKAPYEGGWRKPIPTAPRTSPFNPKRMHPTLKRVMPHNGTDFGCATGTPIGATSPGTISFRGQGGGYGNLIRIKHTGGYESGYAHLSRFESGLNVGDQVERMQTIGYCGSTGRSTGPHLHFEIKKDGVFIDAESLSLDGLRVLPKAHREEFATVRAKYDPILDEIPLPEPLPVEATPAAAPSASPAGDLEEGALANSGEANGTEEDSEVAENGLVQDEAPKAATASPAPAPGKAPPSDPARPEPPSAIFLSDSDLLRMQSATDDGEVSD